MAYREVTMLELREVLRLWMAGVGRKPIAAQLGLDVKTVRRYVRAAEDCGVTQGQQLLADEQLAQIVAALDAAVERPHGDTWRHLGFALHSPGQQLLGFARYAEGVGHRGPVTVELAVRWARLPEGTRPSWWARRLQFVRGFAQHRSLFDPGTEIPPAGLLGPSSRRATPHIYSETEIAALLRAAAELAPAGGLRPHTYVTLLGLLIAAGLRISEALRLGRDDMDLHSGVLTVQLTKFRSRGSSALRRKQERPPEPQREGAPYRGCESCGPPCQEVDTFRDAPLQIVKGARGASLTP